MFPNLSKVAKPVPSMIHGINQIYASLVATVADTTLTDMPRKFDEVKSYLAGENSAQAGEAIGWHRSGRFHESWMGLAWPPLKGSETFGC
ncbi:hypothetical protein CROQUDRAFT_102395 [Cronartium quercuum f. sp. fusiforme G11]|uniref:Uncharacterized protein n=1 Tax=Cronartium quercuum f. sp. fusiforme G11 TaxID=708437 RepID=A0A9P6N7S2_9BASI|nr:hypothetical protein CROQUDRAFT_102395 [Cronartium quercuum f. sp. fusiforme G11]